MSHSIKSEFLGIETWLDERGKIEARATGLLASQFQPFVDYYIERINAQKVIATYKGANVYTLYNPAQPTPAGMRAILRRISEMVFHRTIPATASLAITYRCQCRCIHCSADHFKDKEIEELTTEELKRVITDSQAMGVDNILILGGEPMVRQDLYELIAHVDKDQSQVMMFTNGLLLTPANIERLKDAGLCSLNVSIDSADPASHDRRRRIEGCFQRAWEGALRAKEAGLLVGISTYATQESLRDGSLYRLLLMAQEANFHELTILDIIPSGKFLKCTNKMLSPEERAEVVAMAKKFVASEHPMGVIAQSWINSPQGAGCFGGYSEFYLTAYGDVNPCDFNPITFGNVRQKPLSQIWKEMITHPEFKERSLTCRMQNKAYRQRYIESLPDDTKWPVPIEEVMALQNRL